MDRRQFVIGAGTGALSLAFARPSFAQSLPEGYPADYAAVIEASKKEPTVVMYTSFSENFWRPGKEALKQAYPWIDLQTIDLGAPEIVERYRMERGANARTADILVFNGPGEWYDMATKGMIEPYESVEQKNLPEWSLRFPGVYFITVDADVFFWNKLLLPEAPRSLKELYEQAKADPEKFRGRLTTYSPYQDSSYYLAFKALLDHHGEELWEWLKVLGPLTRIERSGGTMYEKVLGGEYLLAYYVNQNSAILGSRDAAKSQVVDYDFPKDGTPISGRSGGIPVGAQSPNSARLVLDFLLSRPGQVIIARGGRFPYRNGVTEADIGEKAYTYQMVADKVGAENALMLRYEPEKMTGQAEIVARWKSLYNV